MDRMLVTNVTGRGTRRGLELLHRNTACGIPNQSRGGGWPTSRPFGARSAHMPRTALRPWGPGGEGGVGPQHYPAMANIGLV